MVTNLYLELCERLPSVDSSLCSDLARRLAQGDVTQEEIELTPKRNYSRLTVTRFMQLVPKVTEQLELQGIRWSASDPEIWAGRLFDDGGPDTSVGKVVIADAISRNFGLAVYLYLWAESWMTANAQREKNHGGKRPGAGRKPRLIEVRLA